MKDLGDKWEQLGNKFCVPPEKIQEIQTSKHSLQEKLTAMFEYVLEVNPYASWRSVVQELDRMKEHKMAKRIKHLIKSVTGEFGTLTSLSVQAIGRASSSGSNLPPVSAGLFYPH